MQKIIHVSLSFLPNTKYCALEDAMNVDYTPDNVIALTKNGYVQALGYLYNLQNLLITG